MSKTCLKCTFLFPYQLTLNASINLQVILLDLLCSKMWLLLGDVGEILLEIKLPC